MICHDFFIIFLAFYIAFCAYHPSPIRVAETDLSWCRPSRRPRPRLWTMAWASYCLLKKAQETNT